MCVYTHAFISVFLLHILQPRRFISCLFSLYVSFGLCLSCYRLSSVCDLGSLLILKKAEIESREWEMGLFKCHIITELSYQSLIVSFSALFWVIEGQKLGCQCLLLFSL